MSLRTTATRRLEQTARSLGLTPKHLSAVFRAETTIGVKHYLDRVRIEVARYLRSETGDALERIAEQVGCCDAGHLSRVFRRVTGSYPGHYPRSGEPGDCG
jgi:transcriptional regulator GlxA family with amidase domain